MTAEERLARRLCLHAGNTEEACDALVYRTEPFCIHTPQGFAYGGIVNDLRPLWMMWLNEALSMRHLAREMLTEDKP